MGTVLGIRNTYNINPWDPIFRPDFYGRSEFRDRNSPWVPLMRGTYSIITKVRRKETGGPEVAYRKAKLKQHSGFDVDGDIPDESLKAVTPKDRQWVMGYLGIVTAMYEATESRIKKPKPGNPIELTGFGKGYYRDKGYLRGRELRKTRKILVMMDKVIATLAKTDRIIKLNEEFQASLT